MRVDSRGSSGGGWGPRWRKDGTEIYYVTPKGELEAAPLKLGASGVEIGSPKELFKVRSNSYVPSLDGQRFLVNLQKENPYLAPVTAILNWPATLGKR